jgi:hypothetical protein
MEELINNLREAQFILDVVYDPEIEGINESEDPEDQIRTDKEIQDLQKIVKKCKNHLKSLGFREKEEARRKNRNNYEYINI